MDLLHHIFLGTAFLLLLYLDDLIFGLPLGLTSLSLIFLPSPLACAVLWSQVHVAGTLYPSPSAAISVSTSLSFSSQITSLFLFLSCLVVWHTASRQGANEIIAKTIERAL